MIKRLICLAVLLYISELANASQTVSMSTATMNMSSAGNITGGMVFVSGSSLTVNGVLLANGSAGTSGQILASNGNGLAPSFIDPVVSQSNPGSLQTSASINGSSNTVTANAGTGTFNVFQVGLSTVTFNSVSQPITLTNISTVTFNGIAQSVNSTSVNTSTVTPVSGSIWNVTGSTMNVNVNGTVPVTATQGTASNLKASVMIDGSSNTIAGAVSIGVSTNKTNVMKTGTLVTTAATADQVILTYTVTTGKTFYLEYLSVDVRLTVASATASILGTYSLETPSGTKVITDTNINPTTSQTLPNIYSFSEPIPIAAGVVIRVVCTPTAVTSMTWIANFGGYEK